MSASLPVFVRASRGVNPRAALLVLAGVRTAVALLAVPLAPVLYERHFAVLVAVRPTKEVLLAGGFLARRHDMALGTLVVAALPLLLGGVWLCYWSGRAWSDELQGDGLPGWAGRILPAERIRAMSVVLEERGTAVVFLGRLAVFPSSVLAAAAGASGMAPRQFLVADGAGGLVSLAGVVGTGWVLGRAYESGSRWLTAVGLLVLGGLLVALGRWLRRQSSGRGT